MNMIITTLEQQAYAALRDKILTGELPRGARLMAKDLAEVLAISQTPIKGALSLLERDGLVEVESRRFVVVRRFTPADIRNLYAARQLVEIEAVSIGISGGFVDARFLAEMDDLFISQCREADKGTQDGLREVVRLDREFHELLVALSKNPVLMDWHRSLMLQTHTLRTYTLHNYSFERARSEHGAILEALRAGDALGLSKMLKYHLTMSRDDLLSRTPNHTSTQVEV
jgi:DNA-binding GntR family transcriptional regulator